MKEEIQSSLFESMPSIIANGSAKEVAVSIDDQIAKLEDMRKLNNKRIAEENKASKDMILAEKKAKQDAKNKANKDAEVIKIKFVKLIIKPVNDFGCTSILGLPVHVKHEKEWKVSAGLWQKAIRDVVGNIISGAPTEAKGKNVFGKTTLHNIKKSVVTSFAPAQLDKVLSKSEGLSLSVSVSFLVNGKASNCIVFFSRERLAKLRESLSGVKVLKKTTSFH